MSRFAILGSRGYPSTYGGFETLVRHLAPHLVAKGHEVVAYGRGRRSVFWQNGVEVRHTGGIDRKSASTLTFGLTASLDLAKDTCDAALVLNIANGFYLRLLRRAGVPTCVNVDGLEWARGKWGPLARRVFLERAKATVRDADTLVFDSKALADVWLQRFGRNGRFIPYGAPILDDIGNRRLHERGLPTAGYLLAVARIVPENNVDTLLDAVGVLGGDTPTVIVGEANYEHPTAKRLQRMETAGCVRWLGHVHDQDLLNELWANAAVYWHGHSVGGTNPGLLQALGAGAPTLALDTPFNREVIGDERQLVPNDPVVLAKRITDLITSPELANSFSERGRWIVDRDYRWDDVCESYRLVLEELAESKTSSRPPRTEARSGANDHRTLGGNGKVVAVVGPDGAGKSSIANDLAMKLSSSFRSVEVVNFRSRHLDTALRRRRDRVELVHAAANPHGTPSRGVVAASAKVAALWVDLVLSFLGWRVRRSSRLTIVERYAYDLVIDPARLGLGRVPNPLRQLALRLSPSPDAIVMCRAPAQVLRNRKPELDVEEIARQYRLWQDIQRDLRAPFININTSEPVDAGELASRILSVIEP